MLALAITSCETGSLDSNSLDTSDLKTKSDKKGVSKLNGSSVYVSSNTSGILGVFDISNGFVSPEIKSITVPYADADGVEYDPNRDAIYQVNRTKKTLVALSNISQYMNNDTAIPTAVGPSTFTNGRGSSFYNNKVVVIDDVSPGKFVSYHTNENSISDFRQYQVSFEVWDLHVNGKDLWAIEDETNKLAYFENFHNAPSGDLTPTAEVAIEGLVRTHGMDYDAKTDIMVLTDIGSASDMPTSASDGALIIISNFTYKFKAAIATGVISLSDQIRVAGDMTQLGNPVDVAISSDKAAIFVAERAQNKFLVFDMPTESCNCAPTFSADFPGASSVTKDFE